MCVCAFFLGKFVGNSSLVETASQIVAMEICTDWVCGVVNPSFSPRSATNWPISLIFQCQLRVHNANGSVYNSNSQVEVEVGSESQRTCVLCRQFVARCTFCLLHLWYQKLGMQLVNSFSHQLHTNTQSHTNITHTLTHTSMHCLFSFLAYFCIQCLNLFFT